MAVAHEFDPYKLSSPRVFLLRMLVFCVLAAFLVLILHEQIRRAFLANPGLNGLIFGVLLALATTRFLERLLFAVQPTDLLTFVLVSVLLGGIALLACWIPARRAAALDPASTLRS